MRKTLSLFVLCMACISTIQATEYTLNSPDKKLNITISIEDEITISANYNKTEIISPSNISMQIDKLTLGNKAKVIDTKTNTVNEVVTPVVKQKSAEVTNHYNELVISFKENFKLIARCFDNGFAYRFETNLSGEVTVISENCNLNFPANYNMYFPEEVEFNSHNEQYYKFLNMDSLNADRFCSLPALLQTNDGINIAISEVDLLDYPGMWLEGAEGNSISAIFPAYPARVENQGDRTAWAHERENYLAKTNGTRSFPWRIFAVESTDAGLITNQLPFLLSQESKINDPSWIKPGLVAWDWWNYNNIYGVDFRAGVNTETYKYYIDFASEFGIEYIILDEGWYVLGDLLNIVPEIDIEELIRYGKEKNVDIILWVVWRTLDEQFEEAMDMFEEWGVAGLKVDFMARDDQWMVNYYLKVAEECAKRKMLVDFHGSYKPAGLHRMYPNVITREGIKGLEQTKWSDQLTPEHSCTFPFIRMWSGPADYTPGGMDNAQLKQFRDRFERPMTMGTRCHQLALYAIIESPLQMLADNPSNYYRERECTEFISQFPTVWDETKVLEAKVNDHLIIARRNGDTWYVGGITDWDAKEFSVNLDFLGDGDYDATIFQDGINADRMAQDYKKIKTTVSKNDKAEIKMTTGGGWAAIYTPIK